MGVEHIGKVKAGIETTNLVGEELNEVVFKALRALTIAKDDLIHKLAQKELGFEIKLEDLVGRVRFNTHNPNDLNSPTTYFLDSKPLVRFEAPETQVFTTEGKTYFEITCQCQSFLTGQGEVKNPVFH